MQKVHIVTDSTADLPAALAEAHGVTVVPLKVIFSGSEPLLDGVDINHEQFYRRMLESRELSTTSQPTPAEFAAVYRQLAAAGGSVISIHISSAMSGTCQSARMAKEMVAGADIEVIDSNLVSMGLGLVALEAAGAARDGKSKEEILKIINQSLGRTHVYFILDNMDALVRGGRIGRAQGFLGTILNIKPLLYLKEGMVHPYEKVRGHARAIERLLEVVEEITGKQKIKCSLVHGHNPAGIEQLREKIAGRLNYESPVITTGIGAVVGTHAGAGALGIAFTISDR